MSAWAGGSTRRWRRRRVEILVRDRYKCQIAIPGVCAATADCVHHVMGRSVTGDDPAYLVAACTACNLKIGDPTARRDDPKYRPTTKWSKNNA